MPACADNEDIDVQLEVLKPFSEKELEGRPPAGMHGCLNACLRSFNLSSKSVLTFGYQLTL